MYGEPSLSDMRPGARIGSPRTEPLRCADALLRWDTDAMRTTLQIDDDVLESARAIAASGGPSVGAVISELARRSLLPVRPSRGGPFPTFGVPPDGPPITA